ncbi:hypothetical protein ACFLT9_00895 [Acidobacteriota bacterium]
MKQSIFARKSCLLLAGGFILLSLLGCLQQQELPKTIQLTKDEDLSDMMTFYDTIKILQGEKILWEKQELESAVDFIKPEGGKEYMEIRIQGHETSTIKTCDIDGEGHPELVVQTFSGGAHCCFEYHILRLGQTVEEVIHIYGGNTMLRFDDLNTDGILELLTGDDTFAYWHNSYADSPRSPIILEYTEGHYILANQKYSEILMDEAQEEEKRLLGFKEGKSSEEESFLWDFEGQIPAVLLSVMLDNIYTGRWRKAVSLFAEYPIEKTDRRLFGEDFIETLQGSRYWPNLLVMDPSLAGLSEAIQKAITEN